MPATYQADQARSLKTKPATDAPDREIEAKPTQKSDKKYGKANPDFAAMAGWRAGFGSPYHKAHIVRTLRDTSALCPNCRFDLINQRRPDCPECGTPIDPDAVLIQNAPPPPLMVRSFIAAVALSWVAMVAGGFVWAGALKAVGLTALFALQLACGWLLLTLYTDTRWYRGVSTPNRKLLLAGSVAAAVISGGAAAFALTTAIG
ncbi:MAG: hypothetical protein AAFS11_00815 [Planctomycetota bacterium]